MLRFRALGALELTDADGAQLASVLAAPKRLALLTYLALARPRGFQRRDRLVALFWPELDHRHARGVLRQTLRLLRRSLGPALLETRGAEEVGLASGQLWFDAVAFEEAMAAGRFEKALALYQGELLQGVFVSEASVELERWLEGERARLRQLAADAACALASHAEATGDLVAAQRWARRAMELAPFDEASVRQLIAILDQAGNRAEALATYHEFARLLREELEAEPSPETSALIQTIRERDAPAGASPAVLDRASATKLPTGPVATAVAPAPSVASQAARRLHLPARSRGRVRGRVALVALAIVLGLGGAWVFTHRRSAAGSSSDARIAVFPFAYRGSEQLAYLAEGIVDLLSAGLDGVGELRSVDPRTVLSHVSRDDPTPLDPQRGRSVAKRFSAGLYVLGSIVEAGGRLEVAASLYDASGRKRLGTTVGARDESAILEVVDEIARQIVAARYGEPGARLVRRAAVTTRSIAALRAYLEGERAFRTGVVDGAVEAFRHAVREDSGFALAYYRLSVALEWAGAEWQDLRHAAEEALRRADRLSQHDRWLVEALVAWRRGAAVAAESLYSNIVGRYPEDVEAWFQLGEVLFHQNPLRGRPLAEARVPFERVLALEPENIGARTPSRADRGGGKARGRARHARQP